MSFWGHNRDALKNNTKLNLKTNAGKSDNDSVQIYMWPNVNSVVSSKILWFSIFDMG